MSDPSTFSMSPNQATPAEKSIRFSPLAAAQPLNILSRPETLNASGSRRACRMVISGNASSLPDFRNSPKQLGMVSPELPRNSPGTPPELPRNSPGTPPELPRNSPGTPPELPRNSPGTPPTGTPPELPRNSPGTPPELPRNSPGTPPELSPGTPPELPRNSPGTPPELPRNSPGTPPELPRNSPGTPPELPRNSPGTPKRGNGPSPEPGGRRGTASWTGLGTAPRTPCLIGVSPRDRLGV